MNKIEKLFRKIPKKERNILLTLMGSIIAGDTKTLDMLKIKGTDMYRVRHRNYRIIFHHENKEVVIDSIKLRNERTYT